MGKTTKGYTLQMRRTYGDKIYFDLSDPGDEFDGVLLTLTDAQVAQLIKDITNILSDMNPRGPTL